MPQRFKSVWTKLKVEVVNDQYTVNWSVNGRELNVYLQIVYFYYELTVTTIFTMYFIRSITLTLQGSVSPLLLL